MKKTSDPILFRSLVLQLEHFIRSETARKVQYQLNKKKIIPILTTTVGEDGHLYFYSFCSLGLRRFRQVGMGLESIQLTPEEFLEELNNSDTPSSLECIVEACERTASVLSRGTMDGFIDLSKQTLFH